MRSSFTPLLFLTGAFSILASATPLQDGISPRHDDQGSIPLPDQTTPSFFPLEQNQTPQGNPDLFPMSDCFGFKLEEASIDEMQAAMKSGKLTSVQLVTCYLMRNYQTASYIK